MKCINLEYLRISIDSLNIFNYENIPLVRCLQPELGT